MRTEDFVIIANLIILISSILLVLFYSNDKKQKLTYTLLNIGLLGWLLTLLLYYSPALTDYIIITGRLNFSLINLATVAFYFFIRVFISKENFKFTTHDRIIIFFALIATTLTEATPYIIQDEIAITATERETVFGTLYPIYIASLLSNIISGAYYAIKAYRHSNNKSSSQLKIFLSATIISLTFGGITNLILPQLGIFTFQKYGIFSLSILNITLVYLIIRYQFLNIKILIGRVFYYVILIAAVITNFFVFSWISRNLIPSIDTFFKIIVSSIYSLIFIIQFNYLDKFLKRQVRTRFINPGYDPYEVLEDFNKTVSRLLSIEEISALYLQTIKKTLRPSEEKLLLNYNETPFPTFKRYWDIYKSNITTQEELHRKLKSPTHIQNKKELEDLLYIMEKYNWSIIETISDNNKLIGIVLIGKKDIDFQYSQYDMEFLNNLSQIVGVSITRALLHDEVERFNQSLQFKVNEQTKELQIKVKELEEARKKEADMIDIMGHELRTPATIVKLNADLLHSFIEKVPEDKETFNKYVTRIKDAVENEIKLINTLLSSAKLEGDKIEIRQEEVNTYNEIDMAVHGEESRAQAKGLELINTVTKDIPNIYADHARVVEVLNNLISNAVKYTEKGSVTVSAQDLGQLIEISVTDTGRGISQEDIEKLGTKFFRTKTYIESEDSDEFDIVRPGGTGLGLYVSFNLIRKMGGDINVSSEIGKGSVFSFTLPKYTNQDSNNQRTNNNDMFAKLGLKK